MRSQSVSESVKWMWTVTRSVLYIFCGVAFFEIFWAIAITFLGFSGGGKLGSILTVLCCISCAYTSNKKNEFQYTYVHLGEAVLAMAVVAHIFGKTNLENSVMLFDVLTFTIVLYCAHAASKFK